MTMIAINSNFNVPIIIGDLLMSGPHKQKHFILPSTGTNIAEQFNQSRNLSPQFLNQKVYIVQDNLVVAFAGGEHTIKQFLYDLKMFCRYHKELTYPSLENWFKGYQYDKSDQISVAILFAEVYGGGVMMRQLQHGHWGKETSSLFETTHATGSGAIDFLRKATEPRDFATNYSKGDAGYALQSNIILIAELLAQERVSLHPLKNLWGAGFEVTYFDNKRFLKLDDFAFVIFQSKQLEDQKLSLPVPAIVMHYKYVGEVLLITVVDLQKGQTDQLGDNLIMTSTHFDVNRYVVTAIDATGRPSLASYALDTSFKTSRIAMGYIFDTSAGVYTPASMYTGPDMEITYNHVQDLEIVMHKTLNDAVVDTAQNWLRQQPSS